MNRMQSYMEMGYLTRQHNTLTHQELYVKACFDQEIHAQVSRETIIFFTKGENL